MTLLRGGGAELIVVVLAACGGSSPTRPPAAHPSPQVSATPAAPSCEAAIGNEVALLQHDYDGKGRGDFVRPWIEWVRPLMTSACEQDGWSNEQRTCLASSEMAVVDTCDDRFLTVDQRARLEQRSADALRTGCESAAQRASGAHATRKGWPEDRRQQVERVLVKACVDDHWSPQLVACLIKLPGETMDSCSQLFTKAQNEKLMSRLHDGATPD